MEYKNNNIAHCMTFTYVAFAHLTDGEIDKSEWKAIAQKVWSWLDHFDMDLDGDGKIDGEDVVSLIFDCVGPYYDSLDHKGKIDEFVRIISVFSAQDWWTDDTSNAYLKDMKSLAMADDNFAEGEQKWLEIMADCFGVPVPA